jgi:energy-converting hydrogenase Eha subunit F
MNPTELAAAIENLISNADSRYVSAIGRIQNRLYNELSVILKALELEEGYIKQNGPNRKILLKAKEKINEVLSSPEYTIAINNYISVVPKIDLLNVKYFKSIDESFTPRKIFLKNIQKDTLSTIEKYVLGDGLQSQVAEPLQQILNQNINSGGKFTGFMEQLKTYIKGNEKVEGRALSYTKTYIMDSLFTYARTFQTAVTSDLGLTWFRYVGGVIESTREFCRERNGNYYTKTEVESWASQEWAGKKSGTTESTIFQFCGGWNCAHQLIAVSELDVPKENKP